MSDADRQYAEVGDDEGNFSVWVDEMDQQAEVDTESNNPVQPPTNIQVTFKCEQHFFETLLEFQNIASSKKNMTDVRIHCANDIIIPIHSVVLFPISEEIRRLCFKVMNENENLENQQAPNLPAPRRYLDFVFSNFDVSLLAKALIFFYIGEVAFSRNEKRILLDILENFKAPKDLLITELPVMSSGRHMESLNRKMLGLKLRFIKKAADNTEENFYISYDGQMERVPDEPEPNPNVSWQYRVVEIPGPSNRNRISSVVQMSGTGTGSSSRQIPNISTITNPIPRHVPIPIPTPQHQEAINISVPIAMPILVASINVPRVIANPAPANVSVSVGSVNDDDLPPTPTLIPPEPVIEARIWYCTVCHFCTKFRSHLPEHVATHGLENAREEIDSIALDSNTFICGICPKMSILNGFASVTLAGILRHTESAHGIIYLTHYLLAPRPKCRICNKVRRDHTNDFKMFYEHVHDCTLKYQKSGQLVPVKPSTIKSPMDYNLWYIQLFTGISSDKFPPNYLGQVQPFVLLPPPVLEEERSSRQSRSTIRDNPAPRERRASKPPDRYGFENVQKPNRSTSVAGGSSTTGNVPSGMANVAGSSSTTGNLPPRRTREQSKSPVRLHGKDRSVSKHRNMNVPAPPRTGGRPPGRPAAAPAISRPTPMPIILSGRITKERKRNVVYSTVVGQAKSRTDILKENDPNVQVVYDSGNLGQSDSTPTYGSGAPLSSSTPIPKKPASTNPTEIQYAATGQNNTNLHSKKQAKRARMESGTAGVLTSSHQNIGNGPTPGPNATGKGIQSPTQNLRVNSDFHQNLGNSNNRAQPNGPQASSDYNQLTRQVPPSPAANQSNIVNPKTGYLETIPASPSVLGSSTTL